MNKRATKQGSYHPRHPEKYVGDINNIKYKSSWEQDVMRFFDNNPLILQWGYEIIKIPYLKPTTGKVHKYYPDFWVKYQKKDGSIHQEIIELKPLKQTRPPVNKGKNKKTQLYEAIQYAVNAAKWKYAAAYCDKYKIKFRIITEKSVFR